MKTIIFDTSSNYLYLSFLLDDKLIYEYFVEGKNKHAENLIVQIEKALKLLDYKISDMDRICIGNGPGSYTGLRVSTTIGKVFAWLLDIPLYIASSLEILSSGYYLKDGVYAVSMKAKKDYVYARIIKIENKKKTIIKEDMFIEDEVFNKMIKDYQCLLINETNYKIEPNFINYKKALNIHNLEPNYLRRGV